MGLDKNLSHTARTGTHMKTRLSPDKGGGFAASASTLRRVLARGRSGLANLSDMGYHSRLTTGARLVTITDIAIGIFAGNMLTAVFLMGVREAKKHSDEREIPYGHLLMMLGPLGLTALAYLAKGSLS